MKYIVQFSTRLLVTLCLLITLPAFQLYVGTPLSYRLASYAALNTGLCHQNIPGQGSSNYNTTTSWSLYFIPANDYFRYSNSGNIIPGSTPKLFEQFIDLNGDGLVDFIYSYRNSIASTDNRDCVFLNTGGGWQLVFRCQIEGVSTFKGDCAA